MIFGPSSIKNDGKGKPAMNTVGYMWKLDHEDSVGIRKIKWFWTKIEFAGVATADALEDEGLKSNGDAESDAEFAAAMETFQNLADTHVSTGPVQANTGLVNNEAQQNVLPVDALEDAGALPVVTARGGGRGQGSRGHARVSGCGAPTGPVDIAVRGGSLRSRARGGRNDILSNEEQDEGDVALVPVQPRRSSRRQ
ncbi:hypothetical protein K438DRAFT_1778506 [Mycena galopus ATCC 62051]|nr:hypothetical protein K438DRAFT_1778506 [Mycena galopus ATCC 62051]